MRFVGLPEAAGAPVHQAALVSFQGLLRLQTLDLNANLLLGDRSFESQATVLVALTSMLQHLTCLRDLDLSRNFMTSHSDIDQRLVPLMASLQMLTSLSALRLNSNSLGNCGTKLEGLAIALTSLSCLQELDLSSNGLSLSGMATVAIKLQSLTKLKVLPSQCGGHNHPFPPTDPNFSIP